MTWRERDIGAILEASMVAASVRKPVGYLNEDTERYKVEAQRSDSSRIYEVRLPAIRSITLSRREVFAKIRPANRYSNSDHNVHILHEFYMSLLIHKCESYIAIFLLPLNTTYALPIKAALKILCRFFTSSSRILRSWMMSCSKRCLSESARLRVSDSV